jgi:hypothetical protein
VIGEALHKAGKIKDPEPKEVPQDKYGGLFADYTPAVIGLNSRSRATRLRELGWEPTEKGWRESYLQDELPELLNEDASTFAGYSGVAAA